jgi:hypothetical protein
MIGDIDERCNGAEAWERAEHDRNAPAHGEHPVMVMVDNAAEGRI